MRQDCESCGDFVECDEDGICADCRLEGHGDETTEETEKEETEEGSSSYSRRSTR
jgi:hypothetical protein